MPWCDACDRFWTVDAVAGQDDCPNCGTILARPASDEHPAAPWHFKLLMVAVLAYLGWRAIQLLAWLVGRL
ncbi:MAG: hypothetical protein KY438_01200 [Actinobacteria bacterium]|nr:hypothetical protein [Actinomycetota bacterium]